MHGTRRFVRSVSMYGNSLGFIVPRDIALELLKNGEHLCVYLDDKEIIYKHIPPHECVGEVVKLRIIARWKGKEYYALTIPKRICEALGIDAQSPILIEHVNGELRVVKLL